LTNIDPGALVGDFIDAVATLITSNLPLVLTFAGGVMVWFVLKKWVFGSTHRI